MPGRRSVCGLLRAAAGLLHAAAACAGLGVSLAVFAAAPEGLDGETIASQRCYRCHGLSGLSTTMSFPKLAGQNADYLTRQMFNFQSRIRRSVVMEEQMQGLSGLDIENLAAYFSRQKIIPDAADAVSAGAVLRGRALYFLGNRKTAVSACVSCHGAHGQGALMLPRIAGQHALYLRNRLREFKEGLRPLSQPTLPITMHSVVRNLSPAEIADVAAYLSTQG